MNSDHAEPTMPEPTLARTIEGFQWNLGALMNPVTYYHEAVRGRAAGIEQSGRLGVACPRCYLPVSSDGRGGTYGDFRWCSCDDRCYDVSELLHALGLEMYRDKVGNTHSALPI